MSASFAVVGHPNKGKSSIVATLAEDEGIAIGARPGTTRDANRYAFEVDGEVLYTLIDTPGFQRAAEVYRWLTEHEADASQRSDIVAQFIERHADNPRFHDEVALLSPIVAGAGVLYVVDGAKPYGPEYEVEMQILRWTGQPRMALINLIGSGDYVEQWRSALDQYFSIVRVFDAMHADFANRISLLRAFGELRDDWSEDMVRAVGALETERQRRRGHAAAAVAGSLVDCLVMKEQQRIQNQPSEDLRERLEARLRRRLESREQQTRRQVQSIYRHERLVLDDAGAQILGMELFTEEGWDLFGLSRTQLLITGAMTGALAGLGVDALVGGASLLLGAGIGALVGGAGAWFGGDELANTRVLGDPLGGKTLQVGPVRAENFPWVLLGRAWVHHHLVSERNHAHREALSADLAAAQNVMDGLDDNLRKRLATLFKQVADGGVSGELEAHVETVLRQVPGGDPEIL